MNVADQPRTHDERWAAAVEVLVAAAGPGEDDEALALALARWLLRRRKRWLERRVVGVPNYEYHHSLELDKIIKALEELG